LCAKSIFNQIYAVNGQEAATTLSELLPSIDV